jgi:hypothetical protein
MHTNWDHRDDSAAHAVNFDGQGISVFALQDGVVYHTYSPSTAPTSRATLPQAMPADTLTSARDSIGGAAGAAERLSNPAAAIDLLQAAREALVSALPVTAGVSAALALAAVALVVLVLRVARRLPPSPP